MITAWPPGSGEMVGRIRRYDWAATPLGPIEGWSQTLETAVDIVLGSGHAMQVAWGPQLTILYNDASAPLLGDRHPVALGLSLSEAWPGIREQIAPLVTRVLAGETVTYAPLPLVMTRHGGSEQTWWNFSCSPVHDEAGVVVGLLNVAEDSTAELRARDTEAGLRASAERQAFLLRLSDTLARLADAADIQGAAARLLGERLDVGLNRHNYCRHS